MITKQKYTAEQVRMAANCSLTEYHAFCSEILVDILGQHVEDSDLFSVLDIFQFRAMAVANNLGLKTELAHLISRWTQKFAVKAQSHAVNGYETLPPLWWTVPAGILELRKAEPGETLPEAFSIGRAEDFLVNANVLGEGVVLFPIVAVLQHVCRYLKTTDMKLDPHSARRATSQEMKGPGILPPE